ncbi:porin [Paracoccus aminovorans]|uniref:porin n=1 Tax=Paracoccus aminovorans TaxID=34004 RepID=UPI002B256795|nr:porin [Paracoccus aminovorans]
MKKVLFATSALVLTAGVAAAEVAVSGDGRMGVIYDGNDAQFSSRARVKFTLTGESDAGLSFGGSFRVDQETFGTTRAASNGTRGAVWISGTYGKLSMGDTLSASEAAIGDLYEIGYTEGSFADDVEEISYLTGDGADRDQGSNILYEYTINQISLYASATDGSSNSWYADTYGANNADDDTAYALAAKYSADSWWAALGYAKRGDADEISLAGEGKFNNFSVKGVYLKYSDAYVDAPLFGQSHTSGDEPVVGFAAGVGANVKLDNTIGLSAAYQMDAIAVKGFYRKDKYKSDADSQSFDSFGIGADYDLGGGAVLAGGIIDTDYLNDTVFDLGVKFSF